MSNRDTMYIGPTPSDESCAQTGQTPDWETLQRFECAEYIIALRRRYGAEPANAALGIKRETHDAGAYFEVVCRYDPDDKAASDYAYAVESGLSKWEEVGMTAPVTYDGATPINQRARTIEPIPDVSTAA